MCSENRKYRNMEINRISGIFGFKKKKIKLLKNNIVNFLEFQIKKNKNLKLRGKKDIKRLLKKKIKFNYFLKKLNLNDYTFTFNGSNNNYTNNSYNKKTKKFLNSFSFTERVFKLTKIKRINSFLKFYLTYRNHNPFGLSASLFGDYQYYSPVTLKEMLTHPNLLKKSFQISYQNDLTTSWSFISGTPYKNPFISKYRIWQESLDLAKFDGLVEDFSYLVSNSELVLGSNSLFGYNLLFLEQNIPQISENIYFNYTVSALIKNKEFLSEFKELTLNKNLDECCWSVQELFEKNEKLYTIVSSVYQNNFAILNQKFELSLICYNTILEFSPVFFYI